jgi:hypothetical protein
VYRDSPDCSDGRTRVCWVIGIKKAVASTLGAATQNAGKTRIDLRGPLSEWTATCNSWASIKAGMSLNVRPLHIKSLPDYLQQLALPVEDEEVAAVPATSKVEAPARSEAQAQVTTNMQVPELSAATDRKTEAEDDAPTSDAKATLSTFIANAEPKHQSAERLHADEGTAMDASTRKPAPDVVGAADVPDADGILADKGVGTCVDKGARKRASDTETSDTRQKQLRTAADVSVT